MSTWRKRILHWFFPQRCLFCGTVIMQDEIFCADCMQPQQQPYHPQVCASCHRPFSECRCGTPTAAVYYYEEGAAEAIRRMKFAGERLCAEQLAELMSEALRNSGLPLSDVIVPVPLHWFDRVTRGFSQTNWLVKALSAELGIPYDTAVLRKHRHTKKQHDLTQKERRKNLRGAFSCRDTVLCGKRVLLVDDVSTTGTTFREAAKALREAGVAEIVCLAAAKTRFTE